MGTVWTKTHALKNFVNEPSQIFDEITIEKLSNSIEFAYSDKLKVWVQMLQHYQVEPPPEYLEEQLDILNIFSDFQRQLLLPNFKTSQDEVKFNQNDQNFAEIVPHLRLLQLYRKEIVEYQGDNYITNLIKAIKGYCGQVNKFLQQIKDPALQWRFYAQLWQHFSKRLSQVKLIINLSSINDIFNNKYKTDLKPLLTFEAIGAKIWSEIIQIDEKFAYEQIKFARIQRESNLPIQRIVEVLLDIGINYYNLLFAGSYEFRIPELITILQQQSKQLYHENFGGDYESLYQFWKADKQYLLSILPEWIVEQYIDIILFDFIESQFRYQIEKLSDKEKEQLKWEIEKDIDQPHDVLFLDEVQNFQEISQLSCFKLQSFDEFLIKSSESTLYKIAKNLHQSQTTVNSSMVNYQQFSAFSQHYSNVSCTNQVQLPPKIELKQLNLEELKFLISQYDGFKLPIQSRIDLRENQIKQLNNNIQRIDQKYQVFFEFSSNKPNPELVQEFLKSLSSDNQKNQIKSCLLKGTTIADTLFAQ